MMSVCFPLLLTFSFAAILYASELKPHQTGQLTPEPSPPSEGRMRDDGIIPDEFLMRITSTCDDACRSEAQSLLDANNLTKGCTIGTAGISIGAVHLESFSCDIEELLDLPVNLLKSFAKELLRTVRVALARAGTRPLQIAPTRTVSIPVSPILTPRLPREPLPSGCNFNSSRAVPFRGGFLFPHEPKVPSRVECNLFGIDETDGGFPRDGLRTCAPLSRNGRGVSVWILDTGCKPSSSEAFCQDFLGGEPQPGCDDFFEHGTVVGEIATGASGVALESTRHCLRVLEGRSGKWIPVLRGLEFVERNMDSSSKGNVINLSLEGGFDHMIRSALHELTSMGVFIAGAVGNNQVNACYTLPASFRDEHFFSVQAHDSEGVPFEGNNFSEIGADCVDLSAPGVNITTSVGMLAGGTSFATPHVSGAIAVLLSDEREVSLSALTAVSRQIENGPNRVDELSLGLSCPYDMKRKEKK